MKTRLRMLALIATGAVLTAWLAAGCTSSGSPPGSMEPLVWALAITVAMAATVAAITVPGTAGLIRPIRVGHLACGHRPRQVRLVR